MREFDLNIERVLENWAVAHGIREIIANALDEAALTGTAEPRIAKDEGGRWHIRDFGRGVRYEHLTQNENTEKLANPEKVVGKFGVGLKDALATFDRRGITVEIRSRFGVITTARQGKHGFADLKTLHALIGPPDDSAMTGTDVVLRASRTRTSRRPRRSSCTTRTRRSWRRRPSARSSGGASPSRRGSTSTGFGSPRSATTSSRTT